MTTALRKAIANRSRFENQYYKNKSTESSIAYRKQQISAADYTKKNVRNTIEI